jgi:hypothetical protein
MKDRDVQDAYLTGLIFCQNIKTLVSNTLRLFVISYMKVDDTSLRKWYLSYYITFYVVRGDLISA